MVFNFLCTRLLCLLMPLLLALGASAQQAASAANTKPFHNAYQSLCDSLKVAAPDFTKLELELRIWSFKWNDGSQRLIQVQKFKDGSWGAATRDFYYIDDERYNFYGEQFRTPLQQDWSHKWTEIVEKGYLDLPSQQELNARILASGEELFLLEDDHSYTIELLTPNEQRSISYANPKGHQHYYTQLGLEVSEYAKVNSFLSILQNEFVF
ncbi:hypothetical protein [Cesiribacter sp. SM1]|uniref:hypothetical protein n=1 Tax=Cesiribacter sp. SM1 TaxID=2861196 RepID=UPI001CD52502|nr:hypothetical protein [Cesiribacter sp. SM1]